MQINGGEKMNYNDIEGYQIQMPINAVKRCKPLRVNTKLSCYFNKLTNTYTNVLVPYSAEDVSNSPQTGLTPDAYDTIASFAFNRLIPSTQVFNIRIEDWDVTVEMTVKGSYLRTDFNDCPIKITPDEKEDAVLFAPSFDHFTDNYIGNCEEGRIVLFSRECTQYEPTKPIDPSITYNCNFIACLVKGDFQGFKGWFIACCVGWAEEFYGKIPKLTKPEVKYDNTNFGGGSGKGNSNNPQGVPSLPNFNYENFGKRIYHMTTAQSNQLMGFMWSQEFVDDLIKLYAQPMQTIEAMYINDIGAVGTSSSPIRLGNVNSEINATLLPSYVELKCGSVTINETYGSYLDYEPYLNVTLYLPRIGYIPLSAKDVINNTLEIIYQIDIVTGYGTAYVVVNRTRDDFEEVLTQVSSQMLTSIPYNGLDASSRISAAASSVTNLYGGNLIGAGIDALNTHIAPCQIQKTPISSGLLLSQKKPEIFLTRTSAVLPSTFSEDVGFMCEVSDTLATKTGFFKIRDAHTPMINNDVWISSEIDRLLEQGVYIK